MSEIKRLEKLTTVEDAFALTGEEMRVHKGRSVVAVTLDGKRHYLKRFWFVPSQAFKRYVARGLHELRMIDWLNRNGFAGPKVVRRGHSGVGPFRTRLYFLMEEVPDELPFEAAWRRDRGGRSGLIRQLAALAAGLHDAGFVHTDFSERHILVGRSEDHGDEGYAFRLIDVERADVGRVRDGLAANDLATLAASIMDERLREQISRILLDEYILRRRTLAAHVDMRALFAGATPAGSFS